MKARKSDNKTTREIDDKNSLSPLSHFTEQLVGVFEKLPRENDLDHKSSSFYSGSSRIQPAFTCKNFH
jgi:hypothetical protein